MTELFIAWIVVLVVAGVYATIRDVYGDGLGRRQPPPSHYPEPFDPHHRVQPC